MALREELKGLGYVFVSQTDTEVIVHLIHHLLKSVPDLTDALKAAVKRLHGAYGLAVISASQPDRLVAARSGSPLVIGLGHGENFLASDQLALRQVTDRFMYLEEGDIAEIRRDQVQIWDQAGHPVQRETVQYHEGPKPPRRATTATSCSRKSTSNPAWCSAPSKDAWATTM